MRNREITIPTRLIVGLGNPGPKYAANRHNIGFRVVSHFAREAGIRLDRKLSDARTGCGELDGNRLVLARPQTYMNLSGMAVIQLARRFEVPPEDIIVIHDDLDISLGRIRIRRGGGSGGHNGVASIIAALGSPDFIRIRVGIDRPGGEMSDDDEANIVNYVLGDFNPEETPLADRTIARASEAVFCLLREGLERAMNAYNPDPES